MANADQERIYTYRRTGGATGIVSASSTIDAARKVLGVYKVRFMGADDGWQYRDVKKSSREVKIYLDRKIVQIRNTLKTLIDEDLKKECDGLLWDTDYDSTTPNADALTINGTYHDAVIRISIVEREGEI